MDGNRADEVEYDYLFNVLLLGDSEVGKSNLLSRFTKNEFIQEYRPTSGFKFASRILHFDGKVIKAQIWDTDGQDRYQSLTISGFYRGAMGALIVYDVARHSTFANVPNWLTDLREYNTHPNLVVMLVGNKSDVCDCGITDRKVSTKVGKCFANLKSIYFMETSALKSTNVDAAFYHVLHMIYRLQTMKLADNNLHGPLISRLSILAAPLLDDVPIINAADMKNTYAVGKFMRKCDTETSYTISTTATESTLPEVYNRNEIGSSIILKDQNEVHKDQFPTIEEDSAVPSIDGLGSRHEMHTNVVNIPKDQTPTVKEKQSFVVSEINGLGSNITKMDHIETSTIELKSLASCENGGLIPNITQIDFIETPDNQAPEAEVKSFERYEMGGSTSSVTETNCTEYHEDQTPATDVKSSRSFTRRDSMETYNDQTRTLAVRSSAGCELGELVSNVTQMHNSKICNDQDPQSMKYSTTYNDDYTSTRVSSLLVSETGELGSSIIQMDFTGVHKNQNLVTNAELSLVSLELPVEDDKSVEQHVMIEEGDEISERVDDCKQITCHKRCLILSRRKPYSHRPTSTDEVSTYENYQTLAIGETSNVVYGVGVSGTSQMSMKDTENNINYEKIPSHRKLNSSRRTSTDEVPTPKNQNDQTRPIEETSNVVYGFGISGQMSMKDTENNINYGQITINLYGQVLGTVQPEEITSNKRTDAFSGVTSPCLILSCPLVFFLLWRRRGGPVASNG